MLKKLYNFTEKLKSKRTQKDKLEVLKEYSEDTMVKEFVRYILDPRILFGLRMTNVKKSVELPTKDDYTDVPLLDVLNMLHTTEEGTLFKTQMVGDYIKSNDVMYTEFLRQVFSKGLKLGVSPTTVNKVWGDDFVFVLKTMASKNYEQFSHYLEGEQVYVTIKEDGIRLIVVKNEEGIECYTRNGNIVSDLPYLKEVYRDLPDGRYDGELVAISKDDLGNSIDLRQKTSSLFRKKRIDKTGMFKHILFDYIPTDWNKRGDEITYKKRRELLEDIIEQQTSPYLEVVELVGIYSFEEFHENRFELLKQSLDKGLEGLMVAAANKPYVFTRTTHIQKFKPKYSVDLRVQSIYKGLTENTKDDFGGVVVDFKGNTVRIGNGWTEEEGKKFLENEDLIVGKIIEIEHNGISKNRFGQVSLNHPRYIRIRTDKDDISYD